MPRARCPTVKHLWTARRPCERAADGGPLHCIVLTPGPFTPYLIALLVSRLHLPVDASVASVSTRGAVLYSIFPAARTTPETESITQNGRCSCPPTQNGRRFCPPAVGVRALVSTAPPAAAQLSAYPMGVSVSCSVTPVGAYVGGPVGAGASAAGTRGSGKGQPRLFQHGPSFVSLLQAPHTSHFSLRHL